jgi:hypothetical protein
MDKIRGLFSRRTFDLPSIEVPPPAPAPQLRCDPDCRNNHHFYTEAEEHLREEYKRRAEIVNQEVALLRREK